MLLSINKNRNEKDKNNHGTSDYHDHNYTITKANDDLTSGPNSIDLVIPNAFISLWIIAFIYREVITYSITSFESICTRNSDISILDLTHIRPLFSKDINTIDYTAQFPIDEQEKAVLRNVYIFLCYITVTMVDHMLNHIIAHIESFDPHR